MKYFQAVSEIYDLIQSKRYERLAIFKYNKTNIYPDFDCLLI